MKMSKCTAALLLCVLFLCMLLGYLLKCCGLIDQRLTNDLNKLTFKIFLPIYLLKEL